MNGPIPPEFEAFARTQVEAGRFASEAEVVAAAQASRDTRLPIGDFPAPPPFTLEEVLAERT